MMQTTASSLHRPAGGLPASCRPAVLPARFSPRWLLARLRSMTLDELVSRLLHAAGTPLRDWRLTATPSYEPPVATVWLAWPAVLDTQQQAVLRDEADAAMAGRYSLLGRAAVEAGVMPRWRQPFGAARSEAAVTFEVDPAEELRYALELNRHGQVAMLAQAALLLGCERYALRALEQIADWIQCHPATRGVAWSAAIEPAMRLIQWSVAWQALAIACAGQPAARASFARLAPDWRRAVASHQAFVASNMSSHSSANNHLLAELAGLAVAARTWRSATADADALSARFADEFVRQHADDGVNREQATGYQLFVLELGLHVRHAAATAAAPALGPAFNQALQRSAQFLRAIGDAGGHVPSWGDSDEADAVHLRPAPNGRIEALLTRVIRETGAAEGCGAAQERPRGFAQGGYYLLGQDFGGAHEVLAAIDCGPLGYLGIAAHGHADMLSLVLSVGGVPVLVDPGTFVYNARPAWRRRMRGTLMHNTVTVDGADQSEPAGPFLWLRKARAHCESFHSSDAAGEFIGWHDGYCALPAPTVHRRRVAWDASRQRLRVVDTLDGSGRHHVAVAWHLAPGLDCAAVGGSRVIDLPQLRIRLTATQLDATGRDHRHRREDFAWIVTRGDGNALLGWCSPRFGALAPTTSLFFAGEADGQVSLQTDFDIEWKTVTS